MLARDRETEARDGGALIEVQAVSFCLSNPPAQVSSRFLAVCDRYFLNYNYCNLPKL